MKKLILIILMFLYSNIHAKDKSENFSLVISGGISLGAYEAGYNWALLKYMTHLKHNSKTSIDMKSIAGASAGAINALMSSMAWCRKKEALDINNTIEDNLFYHMWTEVDFEDLFIDKFGVVDINNTTSLFSRIKIEEQANKIMNELNLPLYDKKCEVPFGFSVTRVLPMRVNINGIKIDNKLFQIPLKLVVDKNSNASIVNNYDVKRDNIIHLSKNSNPSDESIKKAMYASSAFPIAFEQVELDYIYKGQKQRARFLDGGVFNNVPLDLAIKLAKDDSSDYIFMDPKNLRLGLFRKSRELELEPKTSPINSAIELLLDIFSASESSVLYTTLSENFVDTNRNIYLSDRYFPITGMMLGHFGAFLDFGFREYDYYVGVYDAIINSARYACKGRDKECFVRAKVYIFDILTKESEKSKGFLNFLHYEEFGEFLVKDEFEVNNNLKKIYDSIKNIPNNNMRDFHTFINNLNKNSYVAQNSYLRHALKYPDEWHRQSLASIVHRIVTLERKNSTNLSKTISQVAAYTAGSFYRQKNGYVYNPISAPLDIDKLWIKYLPYELALSKNIISLGYENYYYFDNNSFLLPTAIELKPSFSFELYDKKNQTNFMRVDLNLNFEVKKDLLGFGFGASAYRDFDNKIDKDIDFGPNFYIDFLNMVRITATKRDDYSGQDWYIYAGINDIPSFVYWMFMD